jgi:thiol-disulfide isomerase/thioredoxin
MRIFAPILTSLLLASSVPAGETPRPAPELTIQRFQAAPLLLSQLRGKVVALAFIHTTCSHCQDLTRILKVIQKDYATRNVQVVAVAFEEGVTNNFPMYLKALEPNFAAGITNEGEVKKFVKWNDKRDGILMIPYMIFIDTTGTIRGDFDGKDGFFGEGDKHIRAELDKMLKPAAKPAAKKK